MEKIVSKILRSLPPETSHKLTIQALKVSKFIYQDQTEYNNLKIKINDLEFDNPIGIAAGFDKNGEVIDPLFNVGFGYAEIGTVTPKAQYGNQKPRVFRLDNDLAIINRLGFNNQGEDHFLKNVSLSKKERVLGINIGPNKDSVNFVDDYVHLYDKFHAHSDYITINVSSPNTKNLRDMQNFENLDLLLREITQLRNSLTKKMILLKVDPDNTDQHYAMLINLVQKYKIDGIIATNTTVSRPETIKSTNKFEEGGLSGKPLGDLSDRVLKFIAKETKNELLLIGVGGISSARDIYKKIKLGASLVQLYTALTFNNLSFLSDVKFQLSELLKRDSFATISDAIGIDIK